MQVINFIRYCLAKAAHVAHIPDGVALDEVAPILCAGITVYRGLKESGAKPGQSVAIVGAGGGLGSLAQQYAKQMGLQVIAIDSGDDKREMSMNMGASVSISILRFLLPISSCLPPSPLSSPTGADSRRHLSISPRKMLFPLSRPLLPMAMALMPSSSSL